MGERHPFCTYLVTNLLLRLIQNDLESSYLKTISYFTILACSACPPSGAESENLLAGTSLTEVQLNGYKRHLFLFYVFIYCIWSLYFGLWRDRKWPCQKNMDILVVTLCCGTSFPERPSSFSVFKRKQTFGKAFPTLMVIGFKVILVFIAIVLIVCDNCYPIFFTTALIAPISQKIV